jgi:glycosyltransferase involved in cell wall biosynthesis
MRIGFPFNGDQIGGSGISTMVLIRELLHHGFDARAILHGDGPMADAVEHVGCPIVYLPKIGSIAQHDRPDRFRFTQALAGFSCRDLIMELGLDIVHVNDLAMLRTWALPTRLSKACFVAHWRGNYRRSWSVNLGLRLADRIVAIAEYNKAQLPAWAAAKAVTVYNPCGPMLDSDARMAARKKIRAKLQLPVNAKLIGVFCMQTQRKRTHVLADVLNAMPKTAAGDPVFGMACGNRAEPYDELLDEKIAEYGLEQRLLRPGFVRPPEEWMAACDVVLAPAEREPFGRTALEAAQVGVPMVMSSDSGAKEIILQGETGELVDPRDIPGWIATTRRILDDEGLAKRLGDAAFGRLDQFQPERHANQIEQIYRDMVERR